MVGSGTRIGVNLLTCSLGHCPIHAQSARWAVDSLLDSDLQTYDWRMVVVDNASTCEETTRMLQELETAEERVAVEWSDVNLGIGAGRNLGYQLLHEWHQPEYVVEIHTDMLFPSARDGQGELGWLKPIIQYMAHPRHAGAAIVGSSLITGGGQWRSHRVAYPNCECPPCGGRKRGQPYAEYRAEINRWARAWRMPKKVRPGLSHPAVKRWEALEAIGVRRDGKLYPYDPDMPGRSNFEDTEEALRADEAGWQVLIHFGSVVYHHYFLTRLGLTPHAADYDANNLYVQQKHGAKWDAWNGKVGVWMERAYRA